MLKKVNTVTLVLKTVTNEENLKSSKLIAFRVDNLDMTEMMVFGYERVGNSKGRGREKAGYQYCLPFYDPTSIDHRHTVFGLSVCPSTVFLQNILHWP